MPEDKDIFVLRFYDNEVTPESFTMKELGQLLISLEEGIKSIIESKYPEAEADEISLSLVDVENKSESLYIRSSNMEYGNKAFLDWGRSIKEETYTNLPEKAYTAFKHILALTKKKNCKNEFLHNNEQIYEISGEEELIKPENVQMKSDSTLYGILNKIGGDKAKAWIKLTDGKQIDIEITREQALLLKEKLYQPVALKGSIRWNMKTKDVVGFKLYDVGEYVPNNISKAFAELRQITSGVWDQANTIDDINKYLLRD